MSLKDRERIRRLLPDEWQPGRLLADLVRADMGYLIRPDVLADLVRMVEADGRQEA